MLFDLNRAAQWRCVRWANGPCPAAKTVEKLPEEAECLSANLFDYRFAPRFAGYVAFDQKKVRYHPRNRPYAYGVARYACRIRLFDSSMIDAEGWR